MTGISGPSQDGVATSAALALGGRWRFEAAVLAIIALLPLLFFALIRNNPFERDEGVYATIAQGLLRDNVPYRDLFDNKPPLVFGWYALSFLLFGETVAAPRIIAAVMLSLTSVAVYAQTRLLLARGAALLAAVFFGLATGLPFVALHANTEAYMLLPLVGSLFAITMGMRGRRQWWFMLAGVCAGMAVLTKQVAVWNLLALSVVAVFWRWPADRSWRAIVPAAYVLGGATLAVSLVAIPFALNGALGDFIYASVVYNYRYLSVLASFQRVFIMTRSLLFALFFLALAGPLVVGAIAGLVTLLRARRVSLWYAFAAWVVACGLGVATGGRFYPHYFLQLIPAMAILTAVFVHDRFRNRRSFPVHRWTLLATGVLVIVSAVASGLLYVVPERTEQTFSESAYEQREWEESSRELAAYVAARTEPNDRIFNYGRESQLYFYADRLPATRYFYDWAYGYDKGTALTTVNDLRRDPPEYIIDSVQPPLFQPNDRDPEFDRLLAERYESVGHFEYADVYRLKGH